MFPYTQNVGNLINVIKAISSHGVPDKFTTKELPIWGYKSSNDRPIVGILKYIGFVDGSGGPQQLWKDARTKPTVAVAQGVKAGYAELFKTFPDAHRKDAEALTNFFKAKTTVGDAAVKQMVSTFQALAQYGDFETLDPAIVAEQASHQGNHESPLQNMPVGNRSVGGPNGMTINLNVELVVPTDLTGEVYDKFFGAMKKHLFNVSK